MPVTSRTFAFLQAVEYEMQKDPYMVYSDQNAIGAAVRSDGKSIDFMAEFGLDRALAKFGQGIDEEWMSGSTIAYALTQIGKAVVSIPAMTTMYPAELAFNHMGSWRYASGGQVDKVPVVVMVGGSGRGAKSDYIHAQSGNEVAYASYHGVQTIVPHTVYDCKGMMAAAIQSNRGTILYNYSTEASADIPDEPYAVPMGKANIITQGTDITIATYGSAHPEVASAVTALAKAGIKAEYFDVRTLKPFDEAGLVASVKKTGRLLAVSHGIYHCGFTSHILAVAAQEVPGAKFRMITFPDNPSPGAATMINWLKPDSAKIQDAAQKVMKL